MTLIVGFPLAGFVVLGADGEEAGGVHKASVRKIESIETDGYHCIIGGAGGGNFIDLAVQEARKVFTDLPSPDTDDLRVALEDIVTGIHENRIDSLPEKECEDAKFDLLCGLWTPGGQAQLMRVGRGFSLVRTRPEAIGYGAYLASYLIETLSIQNANRRQAERLCAYILAKAKAHVQYCGGATQILYMADDGKIGEVPRYVVNEDEVMSNIVMDHVRWLFHWVDIIGWRGAIDQLDKVVDDIGGGLKRDIRRHFEELRAQVVATVADTAIIKATQAQPAPTDDPPALPPSLESPGGSDES